MSVIFPGKCNMLYFVMLEAARVLLRALYLTFHV